MISNASNMKQIGLGLIMFAGDKKGLFPENLKLLIENQYIVGGPVFEYIDPATGKKNGKYIYIKGLKDNNANPTTSALLIEPKSHNGNRNVLFIDGHVEPISDAKLDQLRKTQNWKMDIKFKKTDLDKKVPDKKFRIRSSERCTRHPANGL